MTGWPNDAEEVRRTAVMLCAAASVVRREGMAVTVYVPHRVGVVAQAQAAAASAGVGLTTEIRAGGVSVRFTVEVPPSGHTAEAAAEPLPQTQDSSA